MTQSPTVRFITEALLDEEVGKDRARMDTIEAALPQVEDHDPLVSITDARRRGTFMEARRSDGAPTDRSVRLIKGRLDEVAANPNDRHYRNGEVLPVHADTGTFAMWGSSSAAMISDYLAEALDALGVAYYDGGKGSEWSTHISARLGSIPALLSGTIPASGAGPVTVSNVPAAAYARPFSGTVAGVHGILSATEAGFLFTRTAPGSAVTLTANSPFDPDDGHAYRAVSTGLWMGKNDLNTGVAQVQPVLERTLTAFAWLAPIVKRTIVLGHFVSHGATPNQAAAVHAVNAEYARIYGVLYLDVQAFLASNKLWEYAQLTPTAADNMSQQAGTLPPSVRVDDHHLNAAGNRAISRLIAEKLAGLGWIKANADEGANGVVVNKKTLLLTAPGLIESKSTPPPAYPWPAVISDSLTGEATTVIGRTTNSVDGGAPAIWTGDAVPAFAVQSSRLVRGAVTDAAYTAVLPAPGSDHELSFRYDGLGTGGPFWADIRRATNKGSGGPNGYRLYILGSSIGIQKRFAGAAPVPPADQRVQVAAGSWITFGAHGSTVYLEVNGIRVLSLTDSDIKSGPYAGFSTFGAGTGFRLAHISIRPSRP